MRLFISANINDKTKQCERDDRLKAIKDEIEGGPERYRLYTWNSFNNGSYNIDFRICHEPKAIDKLDLGVQIQGKKLSPQTGEVGKYSPKE